MNREQLKSDFDETFKNINVSDELKQKTIEKINKKANVSHIPYIRNIAAIFVVTAICISVYYTNKPIFNSKDQEYISSDNNTEIEFSTELRSNTIDVNEVSNNKRQYQSKKESMELPLKSSAPLIANDEVTINDFQDSIVESEQFNINSCGPALMNILETTNSVSEEEFLTQHPDAIKTDNGYIIIEDDIEKLYIFENGYLIESIE